MPLELQTGDGDDDHAEPGQLVYEALESLSEDFDDVTVMRLLASLQRGEPWEKLPRDLRGVCEALEGELFDDSEGGA